MFFKHNYTYFQQKILQYLSSLELTQPEQIFQ